ncbi:MAG: efflux transporter periplasmic adaptor subunit [Burkholderiales bacterium PBB2]|nr:MAG: efflux transporter periplasmic adaptor subunit [Burkholderiales bacterium PBB2]
MPLAPAWAQTGADARPAAARPDSSPSLRSQLVGLAAPRMGASVDGVVEAVRQTVVAAQVAGSIVQLDVKAGDRVKAGQVLLRIDARSAQQANQASEAQAQAARAALQLAGRELERQQQLFQQRYISQAALDQAEAQFQATQAQVKAQLAQLALSRTQGDFNVVRSPYDGVISELSVALGDMAMPGRALLSVYDPSALRVTAHLPQSQALGLTDSSQFQIELTGQAQPVRPLKVQLLPTVDASSHTMPLRLDLPRLVGVAPGMFARVQLPAAIGGQASQSGQSDPSATTAISVPVTALVRRAEMSGIYVLNAQGQARLRQLRLGAQQAGMVEVLSGLSRGERIALDPQIAARQR